MVILTSHFVSANPESGSIELGGVVKGQPPDLPALITQPHKDQHVSNSQVLVSGTCLQEKYIEIYRGNVFAGMTVCNLEGNFSIAITLLAGKNNLVAKTRDSLGQYGPDSLPVTVFLDTNPTQNPFIIYTNPTQIGTYLQVKLSLSYTLSGGQPPYSVSVNWDDDSSDDLTSQISAGTFSVEHIFIKAGLHEVKLKAIDSQNHTAITQTVIVVNGSTVSSAVPTGGCPVGQVKTETHQGLAECQAGTSSPDNNLINRIWPVMIIATAMTASFWLGEQVIYRQVRRQRHA